MLRLNSEERKEDAGPTTLDYAVVASLIALGFVVLVVMLRGTYVNTLYSAAWHVGVEKRPTDPTPRPPVLPVSTIRSLWASKFPTAISDKPNRNGYVRSYTFADGSRAVYVSAYLDADGKAHKAAVALNDGSVDLRVTFTVQPYGFFNQASTNPVFERIVRNAQGAVVSIDIVQLTSGGVQRGQSVRTHREFAPPETEPVDTHVETVNNVDYKTLLDDARYFLSIQGDATKR